VAPPTAHQPTRVLLIRPDHIGDVLLGAEAVALLRASLPQARLTYLVGPWSTAAARCGPPIDEVREIAFPGFARRRNVNLLAPYVLLARYAAKLRRERFDLAVVLRPDHWWGALLALAAGIPLRVGTLTPETRPLLTHTYVAHQDEPATRLALGAAALAVHALCAEPTEPGQVTQFTVSDAAHAAAAKLWHAHRLDEKPVVAIHPSAGAALKSWPLERWAVLADALLQEGLAVVLMGAPEDRALLERIQAKTLRCARRLSGQSLQISAALYARCALVITVDSGAGHLAAAVGTPTVRLYGPAPVAVFGPWPPREDQRVLAAAGLACLPCGDLDRPPCGAWTTPACLLALQVEDVLKAVRAQLGRG
jgi:heptosyltransferase III